MTHDVMEAVNRRFSIWRNHLMSRGMGSAEADRVAAAHACANRSERRRVLGERGPNRDLPRTMTVPKDKR
jgi:uncharacterized protein YoaH (UPF0181 family)